MNSPDGFLTPDGRLVFSIKYTLESEPPKILELVVPLDRDGNSPNRITRAADPNKRLVDVKPGEEIWSRGETYRVTKVEAYRWVEDGKACGYESKDRPFQGYPRPTR